MIEREITVEYNGKKFQVKFPNVGQLIDIESLKNALTGGKYGNFAASGIKSMYFVLDMVDTIAFLTVMCPKIKNIVEENGEEFTDYTTLNPETMKGLVKLYKEQILPWYTKIWTQLYKATEEDGK